MPEHRIDDETRTTAVETTLGGEILGAAASESALNPPTELPDRRIRLRVLASGCALALVAYIHRVGFGSIVAAPSFQASVGLDVQSVSYLFGAFYLAYAAFEVPTGAIGDRLGVRSLLAFLVAGWSILTLAIAAAFWLPRGSAAVLFYLMLIRFLFGGCQAGAFPALGRVTAAWFPIDERGRAQGAIWMSARLGGALAPLFIVRLLGTFGAGPAAFAILAGIGLIWAGWFAWWFRDEPASMRGVTPAELARIARGRTSPTPSDSHVRVPWRPLFTSPNILALCLMYICLGCGPNFYITMFPDYLRKVRGFDDETASWISAAPFAFGVVGCVLGGWLSDRIIRVTGNKTLGRRLVGGAGLGAAAFPLIATLFVRDPLPLAILHGLTFFFTDLAMGPSWAACVDIGERHAGVLSGVMNSAGAVAAAAWMLVIGRLLQRGQETALFLLLVVFYTLGALLWLRIDASQTLPDESSPDPNL